MASPTRFDFQLFLAYARKVYEGDCDEAAHRSAASRAYYAAYWKARRRIEKQGTTVPRKDSHDFVWEEYSRFKDENNEPLKKLGKDLHKLRLHADYEAEPNYSEGNCKLAIDDAQYLIDQITKLVKQESGR